MARDFRIDIGDPEPTDVEARKAYVTEVATFFRKFGNAKLQYLISQLLGQLMSPLNKREDDVIIKGTINALSKVLDWADVMIAEEASNNLPSDVS